MAGVLETRYEKGGDVTYRSGMALESSRLVKLSAAGASKTKPVVVYTDAATDEALGAVFADKINGEDVGISHRTDSWQKLIAAGPITPGQDVYPAALGRVQGFAAGAVPAGARRYGVAVHAAGAAGDSIFVIVRP